MAHYEHQTDDHGHVGAHKNDHVQKLNAHPHTAHSVGYHVHSPLHTHSMNHEFEGVHVGHPPRDKAPEHHPPKGLMEHGAVNHGKDAQTIFG